MGKMNHGILGHIVGSVGTVTGYFYNGIPVVREKAKKPRTSEKSELELAKEMRMKLAVGFLGSMNDFVKQGFQFTEIGKRSNGSNAARSYLLKNSFGGVYPDQYIDYSKVVLTSGDLRGAVCPKMKAIAKGIKFTWKVDKEWSYQERQAEVMVLVYSPTLNRSLYWLTGARRSEGKQMLSLYKS